MNKVICKNCNVLIANKKEFWEEKMNESPGEYFEVNAIGVDKVYSGEEDSFYKGKYRWHVDNLKHWKQRPMSQIKKAEDVLIKEFPTGIYCGECYKNLAKVR